MGGEATRESTRRLVHVAFGLPAYLLLVWPWWWVFLVCLLAVVVNAFVLPRLAGSRDWFRKGEGMTGGIVLYPLTVGALVLVFQEDTLPALAGWTVLSFADPAAAAFGRMTPIARLPWNHEKSAGGTLAFFLVAVPVVIIAWILVRGAGAPMFAAALVAGGVAALLESVPLPINDNVIISWSVAGAVLAFSSGAVL